MNNFENYKKKIVPIIKNTILGTAMSVGALVNAQEKDTLNAKNQNEINHSTENDNDALEKDISTYNVENMSIVNAKDNQKENDSLKIVEFKNKNRKDFIKPKEISNNFLKVEGDVLSLGNDYVSFVVERWTGSVWKLVTYVINDTADTVNTINVNEYKDGWYRLHCKKPVEQKVEEDQNNTESKSDKLYFVKNLSE